MSRTPLAPVQRANNNNIDDTAGSYNLAHPLESDPPIVSSLSGLKARLSHIRRSTSHQSENELPRDSGSEAAYTKENNSNSHLSLKTPSSSRDRNLNSVAPTRPALSNATLPPSPPASNREAGSTEPMSHPTSRDAEPRMVISRPSPQPHPSPLSSPRKVGAKSRRPHLSVGAESPNPRARKNVRSEDEDDPQGDLPASQRSDISTDTRSKRSHGGRASRGSSAGLGASEQSFIREARKRAWDQVHTSPPTIRYLEPNPLPPTRYNPLAHRQRSAGRASASLDNPDNSQGSMGSRSRASSRTQELRSEGAAVKRSGSRASVSTPPPAFRDRISADPQRPPSPTDDPLLLRGRSGVPRARLPRAVQIKEDPDAQYDWSVGDASVEMVPSHPYHSGGPSQSRSYAADAPPPQVVSDTEGAYLDHDGGVDFFGVDGPAGDSPSPSPSRSPSPAPPEAFADDSIANASLEGNDEEQDEAIEKHNGRQDEDMSASLLDSTSRYNEEEDSKASTDREANDDAPHAHIQESDLTDSLRDASGENASEEVSAQLFGAASASYDSEEEDDEASVREDEVALISLSSSSGTDDAGNNSQLTAATSRSSNGAVESTREDSFDNAAKSFASQLDEAERGEEEAHVEEEVLEDLSVSNEMEHSASAETDAGADPSTSRDVQEDEAAVEDSLSLSETSERHRSLSPEEAEGPEELQTSEEIPDGQLSASGDIVEEPQEPDYDGDAAAAYASQQASSAEPSINEAERGAADALSLPRQHSEHIEDASSVANEVRVPEHSMESVDFSLAETEEEDGDEQDVEDSMHVETLLQSARKIRQISGESDALSSTPLSLPARSLLPLAEATRASPSPLLREAILHSSRVDATERELSTAEQSIADMTASFSSQQNAEARARLHLQHSDRPIVEVSSTDGRVADRAMAILNHFGGWIERGGMLYEGQAESGQLAHAGPILPSDLAGIQQVLQQMDASTQASRPTNFGVTVSRPAPQDSIMSSLQTPIRASPPIQLTLSTAKTPRPPGAFVGWTPVTDKRVEPNRMDKLVESALSDCRSLRTDIKGSAGCVRDQDGNLTDDTMRSLMRVFDRALELDYKSLSRDEHLSKAMRRKIAAYDVRAEEVVNAFVCAHEIGARYGGGETPNKERRITNQLINSVPSLRRRYLLRLEKACPGTLTAKEQAELDAMVDAAEELRRLQREESVSTQASVSRKRDREPVPSVRAAAPSDAAQSLYPALLPSPAQIHDANATPNSSIRGRMSGLMSTLTDRFLRSAPEAARVEAAPAMRKMAPVVLSLPVRNEEVEKLASTATLAPKTHVASPRKARQEPAQSAQSAPSVPPRAPAPIDSAPPPPPPPPAPTAAKLQEAIRQTSRREKITPPSPKKPSDSPRRRHRASMDLNEIRERAEARHRRVSSGKTSTSGSDKLALRPSVSTEQPAHLPRSLRSAEETQSARARSSLNDSQLNKARARLSAQGTSHPNRTPVMNTAPIERATVSAARARLSVGSESSTSLYPDLSRSIGPGSRALGHTSTSVKGGGLGNSSFVQLTPLACLSPDSHLRAAEAVANLAELRRHTAWVSPRRRRQSAAAPVRFADMSVSMSADGAQTRSPSRRSPRRDHSSSEILPSRK
ncbi:hypothetical protein IE81DRAFT_45431 [Ceraceosorus guamensis]|uniref:Uncharacterized protein n=1 Tax=Ceraceosorus guamensis TaxID=1522189 RepID=A0A316W2Y7_9BASI|nr:hypothetical protein IE81DRAFT_45431 [Ceraceosorus guamensis]PWN44059.1 hypothetical protein IE81DRAFT_45431 [Ceraceosorus guamensis]